ncbi:MAG: GerMN domain-containing protein [Peptococcaceae bacterium]|nr:GerMN domain-containing protein [Peptococcaceae bacterium]
MKAKTGMLAMVVLAAGLQWAAGCGVGDKLEALRGEFNETSELPSVGVQLETPEVSAEDLVQSAGALADPSQSKTVLLYFTDQSGANLVAEERMIPKVEGIGRAVMQELLKGPVQPELAEALPQATQLLDINIKEDGLAIVDFSKELAEGLADSSSAERMAVYSIVNTLSQFPSVERVQIRVEGKNVNTLKGAVRLDQELTEDVTLIKETD